MKKPKILTIGNICPNCRSNRFSIASDCIIRPPHWPSNVLGALDCNCENSALVKLAPGLERSIKQILDNSGMGMGDVALAIRALFREEKKREKANNR